MRDSYDNFMNIYKTHKEAISRLKKELKEKRAAKEQADLEKLAAFVKESGKSPEEVLSILRPSRLQCYKRECGRSGESCVCCHTMKKETVLVEHNLFPIF